MYFKWKKKQSANHYITCYHLCKMKIINTYIYRYTPKDPHTQMLGVYSQTVSKMTLNCWELGCLQWEEFMAREEVEGKQTPVDWCLPSFSVHKIFPSKNPGVGCHFLLQGIFPTQGSNPKLLFLLHWQVGSLSLAPSGNPTLVTFDYHMTELTISKN